MAHSKAALRAIAVFKFAKGGLLVASGVAALKLLGRDPFEVVARWAEALHLDAFPRLMQTLLVKSLHLEPHKLIVFGVGAMAYGALFLVEGVGLWLAKKWAEYLTIVSTAGFIPFEILEIAKKPDAMRFVVLAVNVAIVIYLIWRVRSEHRGAEPRRFQRLAHA